MQHHICGSLHEFSLGSLVLVDVDETVNSSPNATERKWHSAFFDDISQSKHTNTSNFRHPSVITRLYVFDFVLGEAQLVAFTFNMLLQCSMIVVAKLLSVCACVQILIHNVLYGWSLFLGLCLRHF